MNKLYTILLLALAFLLPTMTYGQGWEKFYDGGMNEFTTSVKKTSDGGLIMLGAQYNATNDTTQPFLYQIDSIGDLIWEYEYDHADSVVSVFEVIITSDENYLVSFTYGPNAPSTIKVLQKITPNGEVLWEKTWTDYYNFGIQGIEETSTGELIIVGTVNGHTEIAKLDNSGNFIWTKTLLPGSHMNLLVTANDDILFTKTEQDWTEVFEYYLATRI